MDGRAVREVTIELYESWLDERPAGPVPEGSAMDEWLARWAALGEEVRRASVDERPVSEIIATERR